MKGLENLYPEKDEGGVGGIASGISKLVAAISATIAVLVTFTDISFGGLEAREMTTVLAVILVAAYLIYFSLEEAGERRGEESEEYKEASERHARLCSMLTPDMIPRLRDFLTDYTLKEAEAARRAALLREGYTEEDFAEYITGSDTKKTTRRIMRRVARIRPAKISLGDLISRAKPENRSELRNPEWRERAKMLLKLMPTTVCMVITVSVVMNLKSGLGAKEILEGIIKLSTLPVVGARGYLAGLSYSKEVRPGWLMTKSRILESFLMSEGLTTDA